MLLHRYTTEFTDSGNRAALPIVELGLGVEGYLNRWISKSLAGANGAAVPLWNDTVSAYTLSQSTADKQPVLASVGGTKVVRYDGVDDQHRLDGGLWAEGDRKTVTLVLRVNTVPVSGDPDVAYLGGGVLENSGAGTIQGWFNGSTADGGDITQTGKVTNAAAITSANFVVISMVADKDGIDHELSVGKVHEAWADGRTKRGITSLYLGGVGTYSNIDVVEAVTWPTKLTRAERETLVDSYKDMYPTLPFA